MRCEVQSGFLMIRKCNSVAADRCCFCGIGVCAEHGYPLTREQISMYGVTATTTQPVSCQKCIQQKMHDGAPGQQQAQPGQAQQPGMQQQGQPGGMYYDPYPYYPYGGYHPYYWGDDFNSRDRHAFENRGSSGGTEAGADAADPLES
jgi:hypothetical protein